MAGRSSRKTGAPPAPTPGLIDCVFLRRYKRFFADVRLADGRELTVFCPNPGSMKSCLGENWPAKLSDSQNPERKLRYTLERVYNGRTWIGVNPGRANEYVAAALAQRRLPEFAAFSRVEREVLLPTAAASGERSRIDFALYAGAADNPARPARLYLEVKSVSLVQNGRYEFPDSPTARGRKHLRALAELRQRGERAALLFLIQRSDARRFGPAESIDPAYAAELRRAAALGVEIYARRLVFRDAAARVGPLVPLDL